MPSQRRRTSKRQRSSKQRGGSFVGAIAEKIGLAPSTAGPPPSGKALLASVAAFLSRLSTPEQKRAYLFREMLTSVLKPFSELQPNQYGLRVFFEMMQIAERVSLPQTTMGRIFSFVTTDAAAPMSAACLNSVLETGADPSCIYDGLDKTLRQLPEDVVMIDGVPQRDDELLEDVLRRIAVEQGLFAPEETPLKKTVQTLVPLFGQVLQAMDRVVRAAEQAPVIMDVPETAETRRFQDAESPDLLDACKTLLVFLEAHPMVDASTTLAFRAQLTVLADLFESDPILSDVGKEDFLARLHLLAPARPVQTGGRRRTRRKTGRKRRSGSKQK